MNTGKLQSALANCFWLHSTRTRLSSDTATWGCSLPSNLRRRASAGRGRLTDSTSLACAPNTIARSQAHFEAWPAGKKRPSVHEWDTNHLLCPCPFPRFPRVLQKAEGRRKKAEWAATACFTLALVWLWYGFGVALCSQVDGFVVALWWLWVALWWLWVALGSALAAPGLPKPLSKALNELHRLHKLQGFNRLHEFTGF